MQIYKHTPYSELWFSILRDDHKSHHANHAGGARIRKNGGNDGEYYKGIKSVIFQEGGRYNGERLGQAQFKMVFLVI